MTLVRSPRVSFTPTDQGSANYLSKKTVIHLYNVLGSATSQKLFEAAYSNYNRHFLYWQPDRNSPRRNLLQVRPTHKGSLSTLQPQYHIKRIQCPHTICKLELSLDAVFKGTTTDSFFWSTSVALFRARRLFPKTEHRIPPASTIRTPWPKKNVDHSAWLCVKRRVSHLLLLWTNPSLHPSRCSAVGSLHGAVAWSGFPMFIITPLVD